MDSVEATNPATVSEAPRLSQNDDVGSAVAATQVVIFEGDPILANISSEIEMGGYFQFKVKDTLHYLKHVKSPFSEYPACNQFLDIMMRNFEYSGSH